LIHPESIYTLGDGHAEIMREKSWSPPLSLNINKWLTIALLTSTFPALAQPPVSIALNNGVRLRIDTSIGQPNGTATVSTSMLPASGDSFFRVFRDQNNLTQYTYELVIDRPDGGDEFHLVVKPAGERFAQVAPQADGGKPVPTVPDAKDMGILHSGVPIAFPVFNLPGSGIDVVDTVQLTLESPSTGGLRFDGLKVYINRTLAAPAAAGVVSGRFAMFYIPGHGGYFFSSAPVPGKPFVEAGWFDNARMQFTVDNTTYDCVNNSSFLTQNERGEAWVYHDPNYKPEGNWTKPLNDPGDLTRPPQFFTAGSNTLAWWIP
jgi:hypothetical protein